MKIEEKILLFLERTKTLKKGNKDFLDLNKVTKKELEMLKQEKYDFKDYTHSIDLSGINHVRKRHKDITEKDFLLIPLVYSSPDFVCFDVRKDALVYKKKIGSEYFYVEEVRKGRKKLVLKTFYKKSVPKKNA